MAGGLVAGTLEYLISIDSSKLASGLSAAEGKVQGFGNKLSSWAVAKGQMIANLASKAVSSTIDFVSGAVEERKGFDKAMSQVAATLGKTVAEMNAEVGSTDTAFGHFQGTLTEFARYMGANTAYTATEAAEALNYMALAGYDAQKSMNMLPNVLNLAAAGNFDLARASDMVTDAQSALGLSTDETTVLVDQMAKTASRTNTSVEQLGDAMLTVGGTAKMLKGGTKELNAVLGVLADNGIKGSEGGTALRNILTSLSAPTKKAKGALKELGVEVFDQFGNMRELPDIMSDFNEATKGMSDQKRSNILSKIFNKRDLKSIEALLGTTTERWDELYSEIADSKGSAAEMAETQLDNLAGDATKFESALSEAKLALVEGLTPALRNFAQRGTRFVQRLTDAFKKDGFKGILDESKRSVLSLMSAWENSENPIKRAIGKIVTALSNGLSWDNLKTVITTAWDTVKLGVSELGGLVFGKKEDGSVAWPTWEDVSLAATAAWDGIKAEALKLAGLVFGTKEDGTVAWPEWSDVSAAATTAWNAIKAEAVKLAGLVFGTKEDGTVDWPTWSTVSEKANAAWNTICEEAKKLKGFVFGDAETAGDIFKKISDSFTSLRTEVEKGAINIATWFFGDENATTVSSAIETISNALVALAAAWGAATLVSNIQSIIGMFKEGGEIASLFGSGGTIATFLTENKVGLIIGSIAFLAAEIIQNWDKIEPKLKEFGSWIDENILNPLREFGDWVDTNIIKPIQKAIEEIKKFFGITEEQATAGKLSSAQTGYLGTMYTNAFRQKGYGDDSMMKMFMSSLKSEMEKANFSAEEIENTIKQIEAGNIAPKDINTFLTNLQSANTDAAAVKETLDSIPGNYDANVNVNVSGPVSTDFRDLYSTYHQRPKGKAKGDWNVPYDNFLANLHRGEMVLTASQARRYREGSGSGFDVSGLASAIVGAIREGMDGATVNSYMNGNKVTRETNRVTGSMLAARRFAPT